LLAHGQWPHLEAADSTGQGLGHAPIGEVVGGAGEQQLSPLPVLVGSLLDGQQKSPARALELVDDRRDRQRIDESDRITDRPGQQGFVVETER
jgi:hypothetical protein